MRYEFQAFVQATIRLYIQIFTISIGDVQQLLRVAVDRAAVIDFKLNAEMPQTLAMKHEVGRVVVFVDDLAVLVPAGYAIGVVVTVPVRAVAMDNTPTVITAHVIFIKAMIAECVRIVLDGVFHLEHFVDRVFCTAVYTNSCFTHCLFLHFV